MITLTPNEEIKDQIRNLPMLLSNRKVNDLVTAVKCIPLLNSEIEFDHIYILQLLTFCNNEKVVDAAIQELIEQKDYDFLCDVFQRRQIKLDGHATNKYLRLIARKISENMTFEELVNKRINYTEWSAILISAIQQYYVKSKVKDLIKDYPQWDNLFFGIQNTHEYQAKDYYWKINEKFAQTKKNLVHCNIANNKYHPKFEIAAIHSSSPYWNYVMVEENYEILAANLIPLGKNYSLWSNIRAFKELLELPKFKQFIEYTNYINNFDWNSLHLNGLSQSFISELSALSEKVDNRDLKSLFK